MIFFVTAVICAVTAVIGATALVRRRQHNSCASDTHIKAFFKSIKGYSSVNFGVVKDHVESLEDYDCKCDRSCCEYDSESEIDHYDEGPLYGQDGELGSFPYHGARGQYIEVDFLNDIFEAYVRAVAHAGVDFRDRTDKLKVWRYNQNFDLLTGLSKYQIRRNDQSVDHIIELQMWDFAFEKVSKLLNLDSHNKTESTKLIKKIANDLSNLTVTPSSINSAKGQIIRTFLRTFQTPCQTSLTKIASDPEGKYKLIGSCEGGKYLDRIKSIIANAYHGFARKAVFDILPDQKMASAIVQELDNMLDVMGIHVLYYAPSGENRASSHFQNNNYKRSHYRKRNTSKYYDNCSKSRLSALNA